MKDVDALFGIRRPSLKEAEPQGHGRRLGTAQEQTGAAVLGRSLAQPLSETHRPGGKGNDSDDQNRQRQGIIVRPKAAPQMHDFASRMNRNVNVRHPLLFLSIEDRQARRRWLFPACWSHLEAKRFMATIACIALADGARSHFSHFGS
jgi:hypothetical protein